MCDTYYLFMVLTEYFVFWIIISKKFDNRKCNLFIKKVLSHTQTKIDRFTVVRINVVWAKKERHHCRLTKHIDFVYRCSKNAHIFLAKIIALGELNIILKSYNAKIHRWKNANITYICTLPCKYSLMYYIKNMCQ